MRGEDRISTDGGVPLRQSPFERLAAAETGDRKPDTGKVRADPGATNAGKAIRYPVSEIPNAKSRGRVDITRQTAGRGGKTVTVVSGFAGIGRAEKEALAKQMQRACGAGGTVKEGRIEIQGDKREQVAAILAAAGFRPVFAGG
jgi:translation initiation factor 1